MCENMEDSTDVCARRKLEFRSLPFKNKTFYVDVKSKAVRQRVESYIASLGGSVETFLSNDLHVFVSDARPVTKRASRLRGEGAASNLSASQSRAMPLSRGKALLMKARKNTNESLTSEVNNVTNIQDKATEMGIKIEHVHSFLKRCKELGASSKQPVKESTNDMVPIKWEDKCFLKVEDDSCQYKPLHKRLENIPLLYPDNGGGSPFDGPVVLTRPTTEGTVRREKKVSRFSQTKGGFCEMCQAWYKDTLKQHAKSSGHQKFVRNKENFAKLDKIVRKLPNLNKFLFKYIPTRTVERTPCYKSDTSPITSPSVPPSNIYDFDNFIAQNDVTDSDANQASKGRSSVSSRVVSPLNNETSMPVTSTPVIDVPLTSQLLTDVDKTVLSGMSIGTNALAPLPTTDISSLSLAATDKREQLPVKERLSSQTKDVKPETPVFNVNTCDMLTGILDTNQFDANMFSEASDVDSQTNELKNLIDGLSIKNDCASLEPVVQMSVATPCERSPVDTCPSPTPSEHAKTDTSPTETSSESTTSPTEDSDSVQMSSGSPQRAPMVTESVMSPCPLKLTFKLDGEQEQREPKRNKGQTKCMYLSQKTSDTKIRLCKVPVTPEVQRSNLKMFWKVRKTGECRLLFSSEKRKRSIPDENCLGAGDIEFSPLRSREAAPKSKRQRLLF